MVQHESSPVSNSSRAAMCDDKKDQSVRRRSEICLSVIRKISVEPALFLYMVSSYLHFPVFQSLIYEKSCLEIYSQDALLCANDTAIHKDQSIQTKANYVFMISSICLLIPSFIATVFLGSFSDRRSRKVALLVPYVGLALADVNYILQATFPTWSVYYLLISDGLFGIFGGYSAIIGLSFSYGAQDSTTVGRSYRMAFLEGAIGVGGTIGYLFSGIILQAAGYRSVFLINLVLHCVSFLYLCWRTTDSAKQLEKRRPTQGGKCVPEDGDEPAAVSATQSAHQSGVEQNEIDSQHRGCCFWLFVYFRDAVSVLRKRSGDGRLVVVSILIAFSVSFFVFSGSQDIMLYYLKYELNWSTSMYGVFRGVYFGSSSAMILFLFPFLKYQGMSDWTLAVIGLLSRTIGSLMLCFPFSTWFVFSVCVFYMFNRFAATGMRAIVSKQVEKDEQGKVFAAVALIEAVCSLIASLMFNSLYSWSLSFYPGFCYALMTVLMIIPLALVCFVGVRLRRARSSVDGTNGTNETID